jgi:hypothetical protein
MMKLYKGMGYYIFVLSLFSYAYSSEKVRPNQIPFDLYHQSITALNKYLQSGANSWLLICYDILWKLTPDMSHMMFDKNIKQFLYTPVRELGDLNTTLSYDFIISLRESINKEFVRQYSSQLCSLLLSYFTLNNIQNYGLRQDAIIILELLQTELSSSGDTKATIDSAIDYIKTSNFLKNITQENVTNARQIALFLCSSLASQLKLRDIGETKTSKSEQLEDQNLTPPSTNDLKRALTNLLFSANAKLLGISPSSSSSNPKGSISSQSKPEQAKKEVIPQKTPAELTFFEKVSNYFTTIKNNISSFFQSLFSRNNNEPWKM